MKKKNSKTDKTSNKIILNKKEDLNKISFTELKNTKIFDFSGDYFNYIYQRALDIEKNPEEKESLMTFNNIDKEDTENNKIKTKNSNGKKKKKMNKENESNDNTYSKKIINNNINNNVYFNQENYNIYTNNKPSSIKTKKEFKINKIIFQMKYNTQPGEDLGVIGSISELGSWDQNRALRMNWNDGNIWKANINYNFEREKEYEFKFIFIENGHVKRWEDGNNRKLSFSQLKDLIEPNIKEEYKMEFKNINGKDIIYEHKEGILTIVCEWNKK
jgi:hypothetical protein